jgi:hypothetical protein
MRRAYDGSGARGRHRRICARLWQGGAVTEGTDEVRDGGARDGSARDGALVAATFVALIEGAALVAYAIGIGVSSLRSTDAEATSPVVVVIIYLLFAAGILVCARGLWTRRRAARTPFGVIQLFGLVIGWTLTQGDGEITHVIGYAVLAMSVVGVALVMSPALGRELTR